MQVTAKQFNWEITYPGPDGKFGTDDDMTHAATSCTCRSTRSSACSLKSQDVIHSFFVPQFRLKQDAVPGREIVAWFEATKPGKYEMPCAELCGFGHSGMKGWIYVHTPEEYETWAAENLTVGRRRGATKPKRSGRGRRRGRRAKR